MARGQSTHHLLVISSYISCNMDLQAPRSYFIEEGHLYIPSHHLPYTQSSRWSSRILRKCTCYQNQAYDRVRAFICCLSVFVPQCFHSVSVCRNDPLLRRFFVKRELQGLYRRSIGLNRTGKRHIALTKGQKSATTGPIINLSKRGRDYHSEVEPVPKRRRYVTADKEISLQCWDG